MEIYKTRSHNSISGYRFEAPNIQKHGMLSISFPMLPNPAYTFLVRGSHWLEDGPT